MNLNAPAESGKQRLAAMNPKQQVAAAVAAIFGLWSLILTLKLVAANANGTGLGLFAMLLSALFVYRRVQHGSSFWRTATIAVVLIGGYTSLSATGGFGGLLKWLAVLLTAFLAGQYALGTKSVVYKAPRNRGGSNDIPGSYGRYNGGGSYRAPTPTVGYASVNLYEQVHGVAGATLGGSTMFGEAGVVGAQGEARMGALLNELAKLPGTHIFHSVGFPGSVADIDHIVVRGNHVALIDSKIWAGQRFAWADTETILVDGGEKAHKNKMQVAMSKLEAGLRAQGIHPVMHTWVSFVGSRATFDNSRHPADVLLANDRDTMSQVRAFLGRNTGPIDTRLLGAIESERLRHERDARAA